MSAADGTPPPVRLDVRPLLADGIEPFSTIMEAVAKVPPGGTLELTAPFEPVPLYAVLAGRGFTHATERLPTGEFVVTFANAAAAASPEDGV